ncbi:MAG TPA: hypothetical protein VFG68_17725 [Fimbriiglobus sp.]|nr:hypothetical protein [Fimbriiglobus sp.]
MRLRTTILAGALALGGLLVSPGKADAQVSFRLGFGSPYYGSNWGYPYNYSLGNPYGNSLYGNWGYSSPYWYGRSYSYTNPFYGTNYYRYYYTNPGWGPGRYSYRFGRWR